MSEQEHAAQHDGCAHDVQEQDAHPVAVTAPPQDAQAHNFQAPTGAASEAADAPASYEHHFGAPADSVHAPNIIPVAQHNTTYYYSNFDLFDSANQYTYLRYQRFIKNLKQYLGTDWTIYANKSVYTEIEAQKIYLSDEEVFEKLLEAYFTTQREQLRSHKGSMDDAPYAQQSPIASRTGLDENVPPNGNFAPRSSSSMECEEARDLGYSEENQAFEQFKSTVTRRLDERTHIEEWSFQPVVQGFFIAAMYVWRRTLDEIKSLTAIAKTRAEEEKNRCARAEEQAATEQECARRPPRAGADIQKQQQQQQQQQQQEGFGQKIINTVQSTIAQTGEQYKFVKPLVVASEKILGYFNNRNKSVKTNDGSVSEQQREKRLEELSESELSNFSNFKTNLFTEDETVLAKIKELSLEEAPLEAQNDASKRLAVVNRKRRNSELESAQAPVGAQNGGACAPASANANAVMEMKKFSKREEKSLHAVVMGHAYTYLQQIKQRTHDKWQVARCFVTNVLEMNSSLLHKTLNFPEQVQQKINVRFLQPAQEFYNHLLEIWFVFKNRASSQQNFYDYLQKVKTSFGSKWSEEYFLPTQMFFQTLVSTWDKMITNKDLIHKDEQELIGHFIQQVRNVMHQKWEQNIVNKLKQASSSFSAANHAPPQSKVSEDLTE